MDTVSIATCRSGLKLHCMSRGHWYGYWYGLPVINELPSVDLVVDTDMRA